MGRYMVRRVPKDWVHPTYYNKYSNTEGEVRPLLSSGLDRAQSEYHHELLEHLIKHQEWINGVYKFEGLTYLGGGKYMYDRAGAAKRDIHTYTRLEDFHSYVPSPINPWDYAEAHYGDRECVAYQLYEDISEGTPVSPVFQTRPEMLSFLIKKGWTEESAEIFLKS
jgi:hypothetical protein